MTSRTTPRRWAARARGHGGGLAAAVLLTVTGVAFAYLQVDGEGAGAGAAVADLDRVSVAGPQGFTLLPGQPLDLSGTITNSNEAPVQVGRINITIASVSGTGCSKTADFRVTSPTGSFAVPAAGADGDDFDEGVGDWSGGSVELVIDPHRNQNACLGKRVTLRYTAVIH